MKFSIWAVICIIVAGISGIYLGALLNMEGYLGIIFAIAAAAYHIIAAIESKR